MTQIEGDKLTIKLRIYTLLVIMSGTISICTVVSKYVDAQDIVNTNHEDRIRVLEGSKQSAKNQARAEYNKSIVPKEVE